MRDAHRTLKDTSRPDFGYDQPKKASLFEWMAVVSAGNVRRRAVGVVLFAFGLIVQTIANVAAL